MEQTPDNPSQFILYQSEDGQIKLDVRFMDETVWLTQAQIAELFQVKPQNITMHIKMFLLMESCKSRQLVKISYKFSKKVQGK